MEWYNLSNNLIKPCKVDADARTFHDFNLETIPKNISKPNQAISY